MLRSSILVLATITIMASPAFAAPCKDAKGRFTKCAPAKTATSTVMKDAKGKCRVASGPKKGQFAKC